MENRITVSISMFVDLKIKEGADIKNVINSLVCQCFDTTGEAEVIGVDITDRNLVIENKEETDEE
ncbi:MAG: hypothetical protein ACLPN1_02780 [Dissulfurispiraceae bacterium]